MTNDKLQSIIANKNAQLERDALSRAAEIIDEIAETQQIIAKYTARIDTLRKELTTLQIEQINPVSILGA